MYVQVFGILVLAIITYHNWQINCAYGVDLHETFSASLWAEVKEPSLVIGQQGPIFRHVQYILYTSFPIIFKIQSLQLVKITKHALQTLTDNEEYYDQPKRCYMYLQHS